MVQWPEKGTGIHLRLNEHLNSLSVLKAFILNRAKTSLYWNTDPKKSRLYPHSHSSKVVLPFWNTFGFMMFTDII